MKIPGNAAEESKSARTDTGEGARLAVYPGTFDPVTMGHLDIIHRATRVFDKVIIALARNIDKVPMFSLDERVAMLRGCFAADDPRVEIDTVSGLLVDYCVQRGVRTIIRGLRAVSDFEYEFQLALMNRRLEREVETVFMMTGFRWIYISSSIIKDVAANGGDVSGLVPDHVRTKFREKFSGNVV